MVNQWNILEVSTQPAPLETTSNHVAHSQNTV